MEKPFTFGTTTTGDRFTDREQETERLLSNFISGVNTIILSPRRWGKTSLVHKVADEINIKYPKVKVVKIDVFLCRNESDFLSVFANEVIRQTYSKWEEWADRAKRFLSRLSPRFNFGSDPTTDFSISLEIGSVLQSDYDILNLPQKIAEDKQTSVVVCIDEFQQVAEFPNSVSFQKKLRSQWQLQQNVSFCLYGSKMHLLNGLFTRQSMPFYKFGDIMLLQKIDTPHWLEFLCERFEKSGKHIEIEYAKKICNAVENHSSYVQQLAYIIWVKTDSFVNEDIYYEALNDLVNQNSILYQTISDGLTRYQLNFLKAIINGKGSEISKSEVIQLFNLGSSANVVRIKKSLLKKEVIDISGKQVSLSDPVFGLWLMREMK